MRGRTRRGVFWNRSPFGLPVVEMQEPMICMMTLVNTLISPCNAGFTGTVNIPLEFCPRIFDFASQVNLIHYPRRNFGIQMRLAPNKKCDELALKFPRSAIQSLYDVSGNVTVHLSGFQNTVTPSRGDGVPPVNKGSLASINRPYHSSDERFFDQREIV
jgi:hypothetical protein